MWLLAWSCWPPNHAKVIKVQELLVWVPSAKHWVSFWARSCSSLQQPLKMVRHGATICLAISELATLKKVLFNDGKRMEKNGKDCVEQLTVKLMQKMEVSSLFVCCCDLFSTCFWVFTHPLSIFPARVSALETSGDAYTVWATLAKLVIEAKIPKQLANPAVFWSIVSLDVPRIF